MALKEVRFDEYCQKCKHLEKDAAEDPCWDCLNQGWNYDSHKPIMYEEDENKADKEKKANENRYCGCGRAGNT